MNDMAEHVISQSRTRKYISSAIDRIAPWVFLLLSLSFVFLFVNAAVQNSGLFGFAGLDFGMFWAATRAFVHTGPLGPYDPHAIATYSQPLAAYVRPDPAALTIGQAPFPPLFFAAFLPFAVVPAPVGFALWLAVSLGLATIVARRLAHRFDPPPAWLAPSLLFFFPFAFSIFLGQITILLMVGLMNAYFELEDGHDLRAGFWCGLLILKPQYLPVLLLVMLVKRRWQFLVGIGTSVQRLASLQR